MADLITIIGDGEPFTSFAGISLKQAIDRVGRMMLNRWDAEEGELPRELMFVVWETIPIEVGDDWDETASIVMEELSNPQIHTYRPTYQGIKLEPVEPV